MTNLVDLFTTSRAVSSLIYEHYPESLTEGQVDREDVDRVKERKIVLTSFKNLNKEKAITLLEENEKKFSPEDEYEIRDSENGKYLRLRRDNIVMTNPKNIDSYLNAAAGLKSLC